VANSKYPINSSRPNFFDIMPGLKIEGLYDVGGFIVTWAAS